MNVQEKRMILEFLQSSPMASIATISHGSATPESALIAFAELETFEIIFETLVTARKYQNLLHDPHVSLVMGWDTENHITFQYEGLAEQINESEQESYIEYFLQKDTPCTEIFLRNPRARLFKIAPTWLRYSDYTQNIPKIIEHVFKV